MENIVRKIPLGIALTCTTGVPLESERKIRLFLIPIMKERGLETLDADVAAFCKVLGEEILAQHPALSEIKFPEKILDISNMKKKERATLDWLDQQMGEHGDQIALLERKTPGQRYNAASLKLGFGS